MARRQKSEDSNLAQTRPRGRSVRELGRIRGFLWPYKRAMVGALIALLFSSSAVLIMGQGLRKLVDKGFGAGSAALLDQMLIALLVVIVLLAIATAARFYLVTWIGERVTADIRKAVFNHILTLSPGFFEVTRTGEVLSRLTADTTLLQTVIGSSVSIAVRNFLLFIGGLVMLIITSPKLTALVTLGVPLVVIPIIFYGRRVRDLSRASQDRVADVSAYVEEAVNGVRTVQAFGHEQVDRRRFAGHVEEAFATAVHRIRQRAYLTGLVIMLVFGAVGIILWIGGQDVLAGHLSGGDLSAFIFYAVLVAGSVGALSEVIGDLMQAAGAAERLMELLATKPEIITPAHPKGLREPGEDEVGLENVTFHYPSRPDVATLNNFSLKVAPGEKLALVGPSGAGKTTVFQLLLRFYDPQFGQVTFDGIDVRELDLEEVRARIGLVPQEPVIFGTDAWENIRYGRPDASQDEVRSAADAANASEFLDRLPRGFSTFLGERGVRLSGGQRQRIAIARAILRNPSVLLLDEATSALDAESERMVQDALEKLMVGRTTLIIAHRLATVLQADRIAVVDGGRVVETGNHASLIAQNGLYARFAALQFGEAATMAERRQKESRVVK